MAVILGRSGDRERSGSAAVDRKGASGASSGHQEAPVDRPRHEGRASGDQQSKPDPFPAADVAASSPRRVCGDQQRADRGHSEQLEQQPREWAPGEQRTDPGGPRRHQREEVAEQTRHGEPA